MGFAAYIHIPYCLKKCAYCDFNTYATTNIPEDRYAQALIGEILDAAKAPEWQGRAISTVFFGGGTPSLLNANTVRHIIEALDSCFSINSDAEITLEANPGSLEGGGRERLAAFRAAGINRISFGVQSFNARHLKTLGRIHSAKEAVSAVECARSVGFENVSCDLIFAIPDQTLDEWDRDLRQAVDLGTDHISAYNLTYEEGTAMTGLANAGRIQKLEEDIELDMYRHTMDFLATESFVPYEISNFARKGKHARHNMAYWTWSDYLGLGAGAHGFFAEEPESNAGSSWGTRYANRRFPEQYISARCDNRRETFETLDQQQAMTEFLLIGLRLTDGIDLRRFEELFGSAVGDTSDSIDELLDSGHLWKTEDRLGLSRAGLLLADTVIGQVAGSI